MRWWRQQCRQYSTSTSSNRTQPTHFYKVVCIPPSGALFALCSYCTVQQHTDFMYSTVQYGRPDSTILSCLEATPINSSTPEPQVLSISVLTGQHTRTNSSTVLELHLYTCRLCFRCKNPIATCKSKSGYRIVWRLNLWLPTKQILKRSSQTIYMSFSNSPLFQHRSQHRDIRPHVIRHNEVQHTVGLLQGTGG